MARIIKLLRLISVPTILCASPALFIKGMTIQAAEGSAAGGVSRKVEG